MFNEKKILIQNYCSRRMVCHQDNLFPSQVLGSFFTLDGSEEESVDGEEVGEDADDGDEDAVADKEVDLKKQKMTF